MVYSLSLILDHATLLKRKNGRTKLCKRCKKTNYRIRGTWCNKRADKRQSSGRLTAAAQGLNSNFGLSLWSLPVLPVPTWVPSQYSCFLSRSKVMNWRLQIVRRCEREFKVLFGSICWLW